MDIAIHNEAKARVSLSELDTVARSSLRSLGIKKSLSVALVSKRSIAKLNTQYRGKKKPTDVLSFTLDEHGILGEVIICYEVAKAQAQEEKIAVTKRLKRLLIHGIVHLAGYDHETDAEAVEMEKIEKRILKNSKY